MIVSACSHLCCLSAQKVQLHPTILLWYIEKILHTSYFENLNACLAMPITRDSINLLRTLMIISTKVNFNPHFFLETLQRFGKLVILCTLVMTDHVHQNWQYHLTGKFIVYLHAKNQCPPSFVSWSISKILQKCCFGYFGHTCLRLPKTIVSACRKL